MKCFLQGDHVELATALIDEIGTNVVGALGVLYAYDSSLGIWRARTGTEQSLIVQSFSGALVGKKETALAIRQHDVAGAVRFAYERCSREDFFQSAPMGVAFANGFAKMSCDGTVTLEPHSIEHRCRYAYPFAYAPQTSKLWTDYLHSLFRDDIDANDKIAFLGEFFGAALLGLAPRYQRALVAKGGGEQGKSKLAEIITAAFPKESLCAIPPQDMASEYNRAMLAGKRLNVVNELPEATIIASEAFKAVIVGDLVRGRPIREAPFTFTPEAAHFFAANRLPGTNDQTHGFWRRFGLVEFNRNFENDPQKDPDIVGKITRTELPAVVAWMLAGAGRLLRQGAYTLPPSHYRAVEEWRLSSDQVAQFVAEKTEPSQTATTTATAMYMAYRNWAAASGHRNLLAKNSFGARMRLLGHGSRETRTGSVYSLKLL